jgi:tape measure domain-containing protein
MAVNLGNLFYRLGVNTTGLNKANKDVKTFESKTKKSFNSVTSSAKMLSKAIMAIALAETGRRALKIADNFQLLQNRINAMIGDAEKSKIVFSELQKISELTGASIDTTAGGFQKMLFAKDTVGATTVEMLELTKAMTQLGMMSGTDIAQMNSAMLQFSQGLISGTFQAQEFQSVLENIPAIAEHMARGMGITTQELIKLKKEGKLTSKDVFDALISQTDEINKKAQDMPMTLSRGFSRLLLGTEQFIDDVNSSIGLTETLGGAMFDVGEKISGINTNFDVFLQKLNSARESSGWITKAFDMMAKFGGFFVGDEDEDKKQKDINKKIIEAEEKRKKDLSKLDDEEIKNKEKKAYAMLKIDEWYNNSRKAFEKSYIDAKGKIDNAGLQQAGENFAQQIQLASQHSKEFFELNKALAIANIAIKTPEAVANAYAYGTAVGSPIVGSLFAGIAGSAMAVQASAIANQSYTPRAVGGSIYPNGSYLVGENGAEILQMGNSAGRIIPNSDISGGGASAKVNVNVYNLEGQTAKVEQQSDGMGGVNLKVIIESVENSIAQGINAGTGTINKALSNTYGVNRAYGSY